MYLRTVRCQYWGHLKDIETYTRSNRLDLLASIGAGGCLVVPVVECGQNGQVSLHVCGGDIGQEGLHSGLLRGRRDLKAISPKAG